MLSKEATLLLLQKSFPSAQLGRLKNIVRWYDYLQHVADPRGIFSKVPIKRPRLSLIPPAVVAPPQKVGFATGMHIWLLVRLWHGCQGKRMGTIHRMDAYGTD